MGIAHSLFREELVIKGVLDQRPCTGPGGKVRPVAQLGEAGECSNQECASRYDGNSEANVVIMHVTT